jgi:hypothetical protein
MAASQSLIDGLPEASVGQWGANVKSADAVVHRLNARSAAPYTLVNLAAISRNVPFAEWLSRLQSVGPQEKLQYGDLG